MLDHLQYTYHLNYIMRNVVSCGSVGEIYGSYSVKGWLIKQRYEVIFSHRSKELFTTDKTFDCKLPFDFLVGVNPFVGSSDERSGKLLGILKLSRQGGLFAIETDEYSSDTPSSNQYPISDWIDILEQLGTVVHVYDSVDHSAFLVLK